jgi:hypothetical protein
MVYCCGEKRPVRTRERTQPGLPRKQGRAKAMTHDNQRRGTDTLFAAMNVLSG